MPDIGGWNWTGIGAVAGILIALGSLAVAFRSHRASERSAQASEESARAAMESLAIQKAEHHHSKVADLHIYDANTLIRRDIEGVPVVGGRPAFQFWLKNMGGSEAFDLTPSITSNLGFKMPQQNKKNLGPKEGAMFGAHVGRLQAINAIEPVVVTYQLSYRDDLGSHELEANFALSFELGKEIPATIASITLDGTPDHQHPQSST